MSEATRTYRNDYWDIENAKPVEFTAAEDMVQGNIDFTISALTAVYDSEGTLHYANSRIHFVMSEAQAIAAWYALGRVVPNDEPRVLNVPRKMIEA